MAIPISLSVMVPALNEEKNLRQTIANLVPVLENKAGDWEIILVDDGSIDHTGSLADELARREPRIRVIHHPQRQGLGACWKDGVRAATKDAVVWFPGDGEKINRQEVILDVFFAHGAVPLATSIDILHSNRLGGT